MRRVGWLLGISATLGCTERNNPLYCDEDTPCKNGMMCNLDSHGCEALVDAGPSDELVIDGPFVARTVQDVRDISTPNDTPVELEDVVVMAIDTYGTRKGGVWVQEEGGGMGTGVHLFGVVDSVMSTLQIGDVVDVSNARKLRYPFGGDTTGRTEIQVLAPVGGLLVVTKKGRSVPPSVEPMDPLAIALLQQPELDAELERWAGMLVRVSDVQTQAGPMQVSSDPTLYLFPIGAVNVESTQAPFLSAIAAGTCFSSITGIVEYQFSYNLVPRTTNETVITVCP